MDQENSQWLTVICTFLFACDIPLCAHIPCELLANAGDLPPTGELLILPVLFLEWNLILTEPNLDLVLFTSATFCTMSLLCNRATEVDDIF